MKVYVDAVQSSCLLTEGHTPKIGVITPKTEVFKYVSLYLYSMKPEDKIFKAYFESQKARLYFNEIKEYSRLSDSSLANSLSRLVKSNILMKEATKSNTYYQMKDKKIFALKFSEIAVQKFNTLGINVKVPLRHFLTNLPEELYTIILFGSASRREEQKDSDIDLLIVSNKKTDLTRNKKEAEITSKYPLSIFQTTIMQFKENKDHVILQARKTGFPIYKEQNFYEVILDGY